MNSSLGCALPDDFLAHFGRMRLHFAQECQTSSWRIRVAKLRRLHSVLVRRQGDLISALQSDIPRHSGELLVSEVYGVLQEIRTAVKMLDLWMEPRKVKSPLTFWGTKARLVQEPKGIVLIISPWNFPFLLTMGPLVSAIAAGNVVVLKPSEASPATSKFIQAVVAEVFPPEEVHVVAGDGLVAAALTRLPFDHIFFTGSVRVGKQVMAAAAENLVPLTLELGGKSPVILDESADLRDAALKILFGKRLNSGQSCVAPDYVLVPRHKIPAFLHQLGRAWETLFPGGAEALEASPDYGRVATPTHFDRLESLLTEALSQGAQIALGGQINPASRFFAPTVLVQVSLESRVVNEEIFGPILPIIPYDHFEDALRFIQARPTPLAVYVFSRKAGIRKRIVSETRSGGVVINDTTLHFMHPLLPFGGVGESGMGRAHGKSGFDTFSNPKSVLWQSRRLFLARVFYPPYQGWAQPLLRWMVRWW